MPPETPAQRRSRLLAGPVFVFQVKFARDRRKFTYWHHSQPKLGATVEVPPVGRGSNRAEVVKLSGGKWSGPLKRIVRIVPEAELKPRCCSCCCQCRKRCC